VFALGEYKIRPAAFHPKILEPQTAFLPASKSTEFLLFGPLPAIIKIKKHFKGLRSADYFYLLLKTKNSKLETQI
jgi:hypothetical protein